MEEQVEVVMELILLKEQQVQLIQVEVAGGGETGSPNALAGAGGKGVVILAMPLANFSGTTTGSPTESDDGTTKVLIFNGFRELHRIMASFAKIGLNGKVIEVLSVVNEVLHDANGVEQENIGIDFLTKLTGYPVWKQTSYNTHSGVHSSGGTPLRKNHAGIGYDL
jgi:hypothetical protein